MKFKNVNNQEEFDIVIQEFDNVVKIKKVIGDMLQINAKRILLMYDNRVLDNNAFFKSFDPFIDPILFCTTMEDNSQSSVILKVQGLETFPELIQIGTDLNVNEIKQILADNCLLDYGICRIYDAQGDILNDISIVRDIGLRDDSLIIVIPEIHVFGELSLEPLLKNHESMQINYCVEDTIQELKKKMAPRINPNVSNFLLFLDDVCLEEDKKLVQYKLLKEHLQLCYVLIMSMDNVTFQEKIDQGQYSKIVLCNDRRNLMSVAMKKCKLEADGKLENFSGIINEIQVVSLLVDHPRIIQIFDFYRDEKYFSITMEYMDQKSVRCYLDKNNNRPLPEPMIKQFSSQVLEGLGFLHSKKVIHRDIKCSSVLLNSNNCVKISGFGLSKYAQDRNSSSLLNGITLSNPGVTLYNWTAPEIILREPHYGKLVDIWSFGAMLIEMVTGNPPYHDLKPNVVIQKIGKEKTIIYNVQSISDNLKDLIRLCLLPANTRPVSELLLQHPFFQ